MYENEKMSYFWGIVIMILYVVIILAIFMAYVGPSRTADAYDYTGAPCYIDKGGNYFVHRDGSICAVEDCGPGRGFGCGVGV